MIANIRSGSSPGGAFPENKEKAKPKSSSGRRCSSRSTNTSTSTPAYYAS